MCHTCSKQQMLKTYLTMIIMINEIKFNLKYICPNKYIESINNILKYIYVLKFL